MVLYKRGFAGTIAEWLAATDYLTAEGNDNVVLCERGIRTFETATRFTLDIAAVPVIHKQSLCPVCIDVSHPAGQRDLVPSLAYAAVAAGADSLMIEVHPNPPVGPLRRPPAAHARPVRETRGRAARGGGRVRQEDRVALGFRLWCSAGLVGRRNGPTLRGAGARRLRAIPETHVP